MASSSSATGRSPLAVLFVVVFMDLVGFGMILPVLPYYAETFGASKATVGYLFASYSLMQFIFSPLWGRLSDRVGRRPVLLISIAGTAVGFALYGLSDSLILLFASRLLAGGMAANLSVAQAYVADVTNAENRAKGMGMIGAAFGLGFVMGPVLGGELGRWGTWAPGFGAAALSLVNWVVALLVLKEPERAKDTRSRMSWAKCSRMLATPELSGLIAVFFITTFAFANMEATFALMIERTVFSGVPHAILGTYAGRLFAFIGICMVIIQGGIVGRLTRWAGEEKLIIAGLTIQGVFLLLMPYAPTVVWLMPVLAAVAIGSGITNPSVHSLLSRRSPADVQGGILGISQSASSLARVVGPVCGGLLFQNLGLSAPYWMAGGGVLVAGLLAFNMRNRGLGAESFDAVQE